MACPGRDDVLKTGARVLISGLDGRPELNGTHGTIISFDEDKGRFAVKLSSSNEKVLLQPANLADEPAPKPPAALEVDPSNKLWIHNIQAEPPSWCGTWSAYRRICGLAILSPDDPAFVSDAALEAAASVAGINMLNLPQYYGAPGSFGPHSTSPQYDTLLKELSLGHTYHNYWGFQQRLRAIFLLRAAHTSTAAMVARQYAEGAAKRFAAAHDMTSHRTLYGLTDDALLAVMTALPCEVVRGRLTSVCHRFHDLASSSAALGGAVDAAFVSAGKSKAVTPVLIALGRLNRDGRITSVTLGNGLQWGKSSTAKLLELFPRLESIDFGDTKSVTCQCLQDWALPTAPELRSFAFEMRDQPAWRPDGIDSTSNPEMLCHAVRGRANLEHLSIAKVGGGKSSKGGPAHPASITETEVLLVELGSSCPYLKSLRLECREGAYFSVSDGGLGALAAGCRELELLEIGSALGGQEAARLSSLDRTTEAGRAVMRRDGLRAAIFGRALTPLKPQVPCMSLS